MSLGQTLRSREQSDASVPVASLPVAIVRRGETDVFRTLTERIVQSHLAEVIWDRRTTERRAEPRAESPTDRRRQDRRQAPRGSWGTLGFILTQVAGRAALPGLPARGGLTP